MSGYHTITEVIHGFAHLRLAVESDPLRYRAQYRVVSDSFAASGQKTTVTVHALFMQVTNGREPSKRYQRFPNTSASQTPVLPTFARTLLLFGSSSLHRHIASAFRRVLGSTLLHYTSTRENLTIKRIPLNISQNKADQEASRGGGAFFLKKVQSNIIFFPSFTKSIFRADICLQTFLKCSGDSILPARQPVFAHPNVKRRTGNTQGPGGFRTILARLAQGIDDGLFFQILQ